MAAGSSGANHERNTPHSAKSVNSRQFEFEFTSEQIYSEKAAESASSNAITPEESLAPPTGNTEPFFQGIFDFVRLPERPQLNPEEQLEILRSRVKQFKLGGLDLEEFGYRPSQDAAISKILSHNDPSVGILLQAGTGTGKTGIFIVKALAEHARGIEEIKKPYRTVLVIPLRNLEPQNRVMLDRFTKEGWLTVDALTGKNIPATRPARYAAEPDILIVSDIVMQRDFKRFNWERVSTVFFDEPQRMQRKEGNLPLAEMLRKKYPDVQQIFMSATLATTESKFVLMRYSIGRHKLYKVLSEAEMEEAERVSFARPRSDPIIKDPIEVPLQNAMKKVAHGIRKEVVRCCNAIQDTTSQPPLFEVPEEVHLRIPSFSERQELGETVLKRSGGGASYELMMWSEANKWANLFTRATLLGRFALFEPYFYRYAQMSIQQGLYLPELEGKEVATEDRGLLKRADENLLNNTEVRALIAADAKNTPYAALLRHNNWDDVLADCKPIFDAMRKEEKTDCTLDRREHLNDRNKRLGFKWGRTQKARYFFDQSLRFMAHSEFSDSLKLPKLSELLEQHLDTLTCGRSFVFTHVTRHADFLAEAIAYRYAETGMKPIAIHGKSSHKMQVEGMEKFKTGERNILVTNLAFAGTGVDVPDARMGVFYSIANKSAADFAQGAGRIIGRAMNEAYIYLLASEGTLEPSWYEQASRGYKELVNAVTSRAEVLVPEYKL